MWSAGNTIRMGILAQSNRQMNFNHTFKSVRSFMTTDWRNNDNMYDKSASGYKVVLLHVTHEAASNVNIYSTYTCCKVRARVREKVVGG